MARVNVLREVQSGEVGDWQLCFQWCRYRMDIGTIQYGYRFIWRRQGDGSLQAARGQARIPSFDDARNLMAKAEAAHWGNRNGDEIELSALRLEKDGCVVDRASGYVGWPDQEAARRANLSEQGIRDAQRLREWCN